MSSKGPMLEQAKVRELSRGEWSEHAETYCSGSGMDVEFIFEALLEVGLESKDLGHLEYLNDPLILKALPDMAVFANEQELDDYLDAMQRKARED